MLALLLAAAPAAQRRARSWGEPTAATLFDQPVTIVTAEIGHELVRLSNRSARR
jgi:hypothetical protein